MALLSGLLGTQFQGLQGTQGTQGTQGDIGPAFLGINSDGQSIGTGVTIINFTGSGISTVTFDSGTGISTVTVTGGGGGDISPVIMGMIF